MKVNGNLPTFGDDGVPVDIQPASNIPIRLEIATRIAQGMIAGNWDCSYYGEYGYSSSKDYRAKLALEMADALIASHNETCGDKK